MGIDFKATYGNFEEDFTETKLAEDSTENIAMDYEVAMVEEKLVEEAGKEADNKNITHRVPEAKEVEVGRPRRSKIGRPMVQSAATLAPKWRPQERTSAQTVERHNYELLEPG